MEGGFFTRRAGRAKDHRVVAHVARHSLDHVAASPDTGPMAYDEALADRIRDHVSQLAPQASEKRMFGGLAFLVGGTMAVAASGEGGLMLRCDPDRIEEFLAEPGAQPMVMRGREMRGWLRVDSALDEPALARWVSVGVEYAASLPAKG